MLQKIITFETQKPSMEKLKLIEYLSQFVVENRLEKIDAIIENRTRYITLAIEDLYQTHNTNAVLRSAECFGVQDVHVINVDYPFEINKEISMGAAKWLNIHAYNSTENCIQNLKQKGYKIIATLPAEKDTFIQQLDLSSPLAFLFGTEKKGLSDEAIRYADEFVKIPMYGFTESYNVSVSSALVMMNIVERLRGSNISWQLTNDEKNEIKLQFLRASIREVEKIEKRYNEIIKNEK